MKSDQIGCGVVQLTAELVLANPFNPVTDGLTVVLKGTQGIVGSLDVAPGQLVQTSPMCFRATAKGVDGAVIRVTLLVEAGKYAMYVSGSRLATWAAPDGHVTVEVTAGANHVVRP